MNSGRTIFSQLIQYVPIWIAVSTYVLVAIAKKSLALEHSLYTILQILSVTLFEKTPILQAFCDYCYKTENTTIYNHRNLFDL